MAALILHCIGLFLLGVVYEGIWILWFSFSQKKAYLKAFITTVLLGVMNLEGVLGSINSQLLIVVLAMGYGVGAILGMKLQDKL